MNKKKKSTNTSPYPDEAIERLARAFYPASLACWNSEEGQREFAAWQAEQAHHTTSKEKQSVPDCWVSVKQFSKNDTATACQDWLRSTRLGRGSIKSHVRTVKVLGMGLFAFQERVHLWNCLLYTSIRIQQEAWTLSFSGASMLLFTAYPYTPIKSSFEDAGSVERCV